MRVQIFEVKTASGRRVRVSMNPGLFGSFVAVTPVIQNPLASTRITPVRWITKEDVRYLPELK